MVARRVSTLLLLLAGTLQPAFAAGLDAAPAASCAVDGQLEDALVLGDIAYLAGRFTHARPAGVEAGGDGEVERRWFAACDLRSGAVTDWDPQVACDESGCSGADGRVLAVSPDGQWIYLGGRFKSVGGVARRHVARVSRESAALDVSFAPEPTDRVHAILPTLDGTRVYLGGNFVGLGEPAQAVTRLVAVESAGGARIESFAPVIVDGEGGFASVIALALSADGTTLYVGGQFDSVNGAARTSAAAVDAATGGVTTAFAPSLADPNPNDPEVQVRTIVLHDDAVYLCGDWWQTAGIGSKSDQRNLNRFDPATGAVDPTFWIGTDGGVQDCALLEDLGLLVVGGHFDCVAEYDSGVLVPGGEECGGDGLVGRRQRDVFAMRLADGTLLDWNPDPSGVPGTWLTEPVPGALLVGGTLSWPAGAAPAPEQNLLVFEAPLFVDGFASGDLRRWAVAVGGS